MQEAKDVGEKLPIVEKQGKRPRGRPVVPVPEGFEIQSNGLYLYQWEWLKDYAKESGRDGAAAQREAVQWFIDGVTASRAESPATPEQDYDFEKLIQGKSSKKNVRKSNKSKQVQTRR